MYNGITCFCGKNVTVDIATGKILPHECKPTISQWAEAKQAREQPQFVRAATVKEYNQHTEPVTFDFHRSINKHAYETAKEWHNRSLWIGIWGMAAVMFLLTIIGFPVAALIIVGLSRRNCQHVAWMEQMEAIKNHA